MSLEFPPLVRDGAFLFFIPFGGAGGVSFCCVSRPYFKVGNSQQPVAYIAHGSIIWAFTGMQDDRRDRPIRTQSKWCRGDHFNIFSPHSAFRKSEGGVKGWTPLQI